MKALIQNGAVVQLAPAVFPVHASLQWIDAVEGVEIGWSYTLENGFSAPQLQVTAADIRAEAERRIAVGIVVDGVPFKADDVSVSRVGRMVDAFNDGLVDPAGITFRTAAGDRFTLTELTQVRSIYHALIGYQSAVLSASDTLQATMPSDYLESAVWPNQPSLSTE